MDRGNPHDAFDWGVLSSMAIEADERFTQNYCQLKLWEYLACVQNR